jgi:hypothetical protein
MLSDYVLDIKLASGKGYSTPLTTDEWCAFAVASKGRLDNWTVPVEVLEELWLPEYINTLDSVIVRKVCNG